MEKDDDSKLTVCLKDTDELIGPLFELWKKDTFSVYWNFLILKKLLVTHQLFDTCFQSIYGQRIHIHNFFNHSFRCHPVHSC